MLRLGLKLSLNLCCDCSSNTLTVSFKMSLDYNLSQGLHLNSYHSQKGRYLQPELTLGLDLASCVFFCGVSESESSSESVSEQEELSDEELLSWFPGPLPFSSEVLNT